jgi:hypothetical protein
MIIDDCVLIGTLQRNINKNKSQCHLNLNKY